MSPRPPQGPGSATDQLIQKNSSIPAERPTTGAAPVVRPHHINPRALAHAASVGGEQADALKMLNLLQPQRPGNPSTEAPAPQVEAAAPSAAPEPIPAPTPPPEPAVPPQYPAGQLVQRYEPTKAAPLDQTHYEFIMNPAAPPKAGGGGSTSKRLAIVASAGILVLIIVIVLASLLKGGGGDQNDMFTVAQEQTELLRVAAQVEGHTNQPSTLELANAVTINLTSAQQQTLQYFKQANLKYNVKQLTLKHSAQTDTELNTAVANSTFDKVFQQVIQTDLTNYSNALQRAYRASSGPKGRSLLKTQYNGAALLLQQSKAT